MISLFSKSKTMGAYYAKQPNGLYCRFSTVVDSVTHWNITKEQAINMQLGYLDVTPAEQKIREDMFDKRLKPFETIKKDFTAANDTIEEFQDLLKEMGDTEGLSDEKIKEIKDWMREMEEEKAEEELLHCEQGVC